VKFGTGGESIIYVFIRRNENILKELILDPVAKKLA
jgi:hypothetical protein